VKNYQDRARLKLHASTKPGHINYFRLLGQHLNVSSSAFSFVRPSVTNGLNKKQQYVFNHFIAATRTPFRKDTINFTDETLLKLAKAYVAGGVFL